MANRRMFSKSITNSSRFLMMPQSSQNLYFHLGMNADDDGFCEHFTLMRMTESKPDDLKVLAAKGFVKVFDDRVLVVIDWKENNYLRSDRYTPSKYLEIYKEELKELSSGIPMVSIGKDRIGKELNTGGNPTDSAFKENYLSKFKKPKKVYSAAGALADEIHEWDSRLEFPMLLRLIKSKGEQFIRQTYAEVKQSDAKEPYKLFMYKIGETKIIKQ